MSGGLWEAQRHNCIFEGCAFDLVLNKFTSQWILISILTLLASGLYDVQWFLRPQWFRFNQERK